MNTAVSTVWKLIEERLDLKIEKGADVSKMKWFLLVISMKNFEESTNIAIKAGHSDKTHHYILSRPF
jgi:hypothetical protein